MKRKHNHPARQATQPAGSAPPVPLDEQLQQAAALHRAGQLPEAEALYRQVLQANPHHPDALHLLGMVASHTGRHAVAIDLLDRAIRSNPQFADAYYTRGNALFAVERYQAALESYNQAIQLNPVHAEAWHNRGSVFHALLQYEAAIASYDKALALKPDYAEAQTNRAGSLQAIEWYRAALENYNIALRAESGEQATSVTPLAEKEAARIAEIESKAELKAALDALPVALRSHPAVSNLRSLRCPRTESTGRDLVFYCAATHEIWNPRTAETGGIGGSEEAVIWLSRLLHQRGWKVTVYAGCGAEERDYDGVCWKPVWMWSCRDQQDVTVVWRHPQLLAYPIQSGKVILDLHDAVLQETFPADGLAKVHKVFVKSNFHRSLLPGIPEEKFVVASNGIDASLFAGPVERDPMLLINTSSADRSIDAFLDCFEEIKKQVPGAKAQWAYGWGVWDRFYASNPARLEWKALAIERMRQLGMEDLGRLSHSQIAELYRRANIFAFPTEFVEIDCISLSKAMAAGAIPITTNFAAMGEKSGHGGVFLPTRKTIYDWVQPGQFRFGITDPEQKAQFVREAVKLLLDPPSEQAREPMREWARLTFDWHRIADIWHQVLAEESVAAAEVVAPPAVDAPPITAEPSAEAARHFQQGLAHHQAGRLPEAEALYWQVLQSAPNHLDAVYLLGMIAYQVGKFDTALELTDRAIAINPKAPEPHASRGNILHSLGRYREALASFDEATRLNPNFADALSNRGNALHSLGRFQDALASFERALRLKPDFPDALSNRATTLLELRQHSAALEDCDRAVRLNPAFAQAWSNRGNALHGLERYQEAFESYDRATQLKPDYAEAWSNRGNALHALERYQEAIASFDQAIRLNPGYANAYNNRGNVFHVLEQPLPALHDFDQAILLNPDHSEAHHNRGAVLHEMQRYAEALASFNRTIELRPDIDYLYGLRLHMRVFQCDWQGIEQECRHLETLVEQGRKATSPFVLLATIDSPALHRRAAEMYARDKMARHTPAFIPRRPPRERIRIGYFSADFHNHATTYLMAELLEQHDRSRFEIIGFSFGPNIEDEMRVRVSSAMDSFHNVRARSDRAIAELSRSLGIDIAVDLKGFTKDSRPAIFAERAAPIQVSYLGYPGTMGAACMDYLVADPTLIPEASEQHYSEKILYLPNSYQINDSKRPISAAPVTRAAEGLPEHAFVFCCFNVNWKIAPATFDVWMRILAQVEGSVLWLLEDNPWVAANLRKEAAGRGIAPERLIFAARRPLADHLARHRLADLFLDTLPYNAHTTASDALWAGLPVLTCMGQTFASRVGASLLRAIGLPELITTTPESYEALALELARNPARLQALREKLAHNRLTTPLFDTVRFTRNLEAAYTAIYARYQANLPPDHIHIAESASL